MIYHLKPELDNGNIGLYFKERCIGSVWWRSSGKQTVELELLEVNAAYQGRKLGTKLLQAALQEIRKLFPQAKYISGRATSKGIARLLTRELGRELTYNSQEKLPRQSPVKWRSTLNRVRVRFKLR